MASKFASIGIAVLFRSPIRVRPYLRYVPRLCYSSAAGDPSHPWPEWIEFVDQLTEKGYFTDESLSEVKEAGQRLYRDEKLLKDACINFARDRYDLINSLLKKDIETVVGGGCPNVLKEVVNSAKRLRCHVNLDERAVCSYCNLRGSCDSAYINLEESEANTRTVDIVRVLMFYALDPDLTSGGEKPDRIELVESSARKLLSELLRLSQKACDPALAMLPAKARKKNKDMAEKPWTCIKCQFYNFEKNLRCLRCNKFGPGRSGNPEYAGAKAKEWTCPKCGYINFQRNKTACRKCKAEVPDTVKKFEKRPGDWMCQGCRFMNFAVNMYCKDCNLQRSEIQLKPKKRFYPVCDYKGEVCDERGRESPLEAKVSQDWEEICRDFDNQFGC